MKFGSELNRNHWRVVKNLKLKRVDDFGVVYKVVRDLKSNVVSCTFVLIFDFNVAIEGGELLNLLELRNFEFYSDVGVLVKGFRIFETIVGFEHLYWGMKLEMKSSASMKECINHH